MVAVRSCDTYMSIHALMLSWEDLKQQKLKVIETISCAFPDYSKEEAIEKQILLL